MHRLRIFSWGLNPCCSGQWSRTLGDDIAFMAMAVLILVVVDNGLVRLHHSCIHWKKQGLNPCCNGQWSRTKMEQLYASLPVGLNPCCNGRWSRT